MSEKKVSFVSLGCPKALVDSEHIVTELVEQGFDVVSTEEDAQVTVINTCGFIDAAKDESYGAIDEALALGHEVIVTGCLGADRDALLQKFPGLKHVSGPQLVSPVIDAVRSSLPATEEAGTDAPSGRLPGEARARGNGVLLTPSHYAYLKVAEGCNHTCSFCIIPDMRGPLRSRPIAEVLREAQGLREQGVKEVMVIAQDLSAYGSDIRYADNTRLRPLCEALGDLFDWVRLHYVYPYPHVDDLIPLMADRVVLPYLDVPLQHASPRILKAMRRPAAAEKTLERIMAWRRICPELAIRSTFIVGFPGETEEDVGLLLDFLEAAELDRVGCFTYSPVAGARANALPDQVPEREKLDRQERVYEVQAQISRARLDRLVGTRLRVIVDEAEHDVATARSIYDAPEIDGIVHVSDGGQLNPGDFAWVEVEGYDDHDLTARFVGTSLTL
jgi:ribosomal protein S12 methylthiotransferase